jgi:hypothetical protein
VGNAGVNHADFLGLTWSSDKGVEALKLALQVKAGNKLPDNHKCCKDLRELSLNKCNTADCVTFTTAVISCGYRLNNDNASADLIIRWFRAAAGDGEAISKKMISSLSWKPVYYDRDFTTHRHAYSREELKSGGLRCPSSIYGEDLVWAARQIAQGKGLHGIIPVGSVTDFAPWSPPAGFQLPGSYDELAKMKFSLVVAYGGFHNFILSSDMVYEGLPRITDGPKVTKSFAGWASRGAYSDALGFILVAPDTAVGNEMKNDLKALLGKKLLDFEKIIP